MFNVSYKPKPRGLLAGPPPSPPVTNGRPMIGRRSLGPPGGPPPAAVGIGPGRRGPAWATQKGAPLFPLPRESRKVASSTSWRLHVRSEHRTKRRRAGGRAGGRAGRRAQGRGRGSGAELRRAAAEVRAWVGRFAGSGLPGGRRPRLLANGGGEQGGVTRGGGPPTRMVGRRPAFFSDRAPHRRRVGLGVGVKLDLGRRY